MTTYTNIDEIRVSPGIGMGRVGNSDEYFIGPETPGTIPSPDSFFISDGCPGTAPGKYKDTSGAIKRQAQRFRVYGYLADGTYAGEIKHGDSVNGQTVSLSWQVHVTNMKAANYAFQGQYVFDPKQLRNSTIQGLSTNPSGLPADRDKLIIDPGLKTIEGVSQAAVELLDTEGDGSVIFDIPDTPAPLPLSSLLQFTPPQPANGDWGDGTVAVTYTSATVSLGSVLTDAEGRLIFVGGAGISRSCTTPVVVISKIVDETASTNPENNPEYNGNSYFNNPGWYDDTCGGSINVALMSGTNPVLAPNGTTALSTSNNASQQGWVAIAPPHYAPTTYNVVSLLDLQLDIYPRIDPHTGKGPFTFSYLASDGALKVATSTTGEASSLTFDTVPTTVSSTTFTAAFAPAMAVLQNSTHIAVIDTSGNLYNGVPGVGSAYNFTQLTTTPSVTSVTAAPAVAVLNDVLYYAVNNNGALNIGTVDGGFTALTQTYKDSAGVDQLISVNAAQPPAMAAFNGSLYYAAVSNGGTIYLASSLGDGAASNFAFAALDNSVDVKTNTGLGLCYFAGKLYCAFVGVDNGLYIGSSTDGLSFSFGSALDVVTDADGASLSAFNNQLYYGVGSGDGAMLGVSNDGSSFSFSSLTSDATSAPAIVTDIPVNFYRDIYPILKTVTDYAWTNERAFHGHRPGSMGDFLSATHIRGLEAPGVPGMSIVYTRPFVFNFIRPPVQETYLETTYELNGVKTKELSTEPYSIPIPPLPALPAIPNPNPVIPGLGEITGYQIASAPDVEQRADLMPRLFGNGGSVPENITNGTQHPNQWLSLTDHQLEKFQLWVNGNFSMGDLVTDKQWQGLNEADQLSFAALQPTVGGGFHPGIELTYLMQEQAFFQGPFRFAPDTVPGSIAAYMSVPWQGDFWSCNISWWPSLRPDIVVETSVDTPPVLSHISWFRGNVIPPESDSISAYDGGYNVMVERWRDFGFVTPTGTTDLGEMIFGETERNKALDEPSVIVSINDLNVSNGTALDYNGTSFTAAPVSTAETAQQWTLTNNDNALGYFYIQLAGTEEFLTTDFAGALSLAPLAVPSNSGQSWQYGPSGYPGQFTITNQINLKLLSVESSGNVVLKSAPSDDQQLWFLQAATEVTPLEPPKLKFCW